MRKLCEKLLQRAEIKDIPLMYVFTVAYVVFEIINDGECFYDSEEKECLSSITQIPQVVE